ncbi:conditioned medium factor [Simiduia litorea]|uniref:choice-of-anchor X domain-containing protein n=1 Tax=Simiduia litorea TaxID=1435348 RepID=UPI0036F22B8B
MKRLTPYLIFSLLPLVGLSTFCHADAYKHLAAEPSQASAQRLADPKDLGVFSHTALIPLSAQQQEQSFVIDNLDASPVALIGPDTDQLRLSLIDPDGQQQLHEAITEPSSIATRDLQIGSESFPAKQFELRANKPGRWKLKWADTAGTKAEDAQTKRYLMVKGDPNVKLYSYRDNVQTTLGSQVNLVAYMVAAQGKRGQRTKLLNTQAFTGNIEQAQVLITQPDGQSMTIELHDDGRNGDATAGDGQYSATLPTQLVGVYTQELQVTGTRPDGLAFSRTVTDLYPVIEQSFAIANAQATLVQGADTAEVRVPVRINGKDKNVFVGAEVWGTNAQGKREMATWVGGIATVNSDADQAYLSLYLDSQWLSQNNLRAPYQLRAIRLQNVDNHTPMDQRSRMSTALQTELAPMLANSRVANTGVRTDSQGDKRVRIVGDSAANLKTSSNLVQTAATGSTLMLVHGYCSNGGWNTNHFTNAVEFKDYNANRSHDAFAKKIRDAGAGYSSFGVVAHSQGGAAALHLYAKYVSGLDNASGGRLIQSVGTPYQGTALAGNLAVLGQIFGAGCGKNTDLTYSGASNWLSTIPTWARNQVDYYTTSFKTRWWAYDYCHLATDLLLDDPEDGTTEKWSGQLSGAVNKGHKTGWCHTSGMRDPAQTGDTSRNSSMNSRAAR